MSCANIHTFLPKNCLNGSIFCSFIVADDFVCLECWVQLVIHNWRYFRIIDPKFSGSNLSRILYKCWVLRLMENNKSARITPESPPPEEKFPQSFGDGDRDPRQIARKKLPLFELTLPDGLLDAYRAWKRQKRVLKTRKRRATSDSKGPKTLPDPRLGPDFDSKDPLGLCRWSLIFKSVNEEKRFDFQVA